MSRKLLISIVTPSYRQTDWLQLAIASVADQTGVEVEHIVQDAGTENIHAFFEKQTAPRASARYIPRLVVEKDQGMYDAINRGLTKSRGEILGYLNCDEQYLPGALREVSDYFARHPDVDVLFGDAILIDSTGSPLSYRRTTLPTLSHLRAAPLNTLTCATFFRRRVLDRGHLFPVHLKVAGDQYWVFELLRAGVSMGVVSKALSVFTFTGGNLSHSTIADQEKSSWLPVGEKPTRFGRPFMILWHRIRKLFAGAYRPRKVDIEVYTGASPAQRRPISKWVGFFWPVTAR